MKRLLAERDLEIDVMKEVLAKSGKRRCPSGSSGIYQDTEDFRTAQLAIDRLELAQSSVSAKEKTGSKIDQTNQGVGNDSSAIRVSANLGNARTRAIKSKFEKNLSVVEAGETEST